MSKSAVKSRAFGTSYCFLQYSYRGKDKEFATNFIK